MILTNPTTGQQSIRPDSRGIPGRLQTAFETRPPAGTTPTKLTRDKYHWPREFREKVRPEMKLFRVLDEFAERMVSPRQWRSQETIQDAIEAEYGERLPRRTYQAAMKWLKDRGLVVISPELIRDRSGEFRPVEMIWCTWRLDPADHPPAPAEDAQDPAQDAPLFAPLAQDSAPGIAPNPAPSKSVLFEVRTRTRSTAAAPPPRAEEAPAGPAAAAGPDHAAAPPPAPAYTVAECEAALAAPATKGMLAWPYLWALEDHGRAELIPARFAGKVPQRPAEAEVAKAESRRAGVVAAASPAARAATTIEGRILAAGSLDAKGLRLLARDCADELDDQQWEAKWRREIRAIASGPVPLATVAKLWGKAKASNHSARGRLFFGRLDEMRAEAIAGGALR